MILCMEEWVSKGTYTLISTRPNVFVQVSQKITLAIRLVNGNHSHEEQKLSGTFDYR
jgi:hypothetical protein